MKLEEYELAPNGTAEEGFLEEQTIQELDLLERNEPSESDLCEIEEEDQDVIEEEQEDFYLQDVLSHPLLTAQEEVDLARRIQAGDKEAMDKMILCNQRLVLSIARHYQHQGLDFLDLVQEGNLGLMTAIKKFDPNMGWKFSTYSTWWIKQAITRGISDKARTIRIPVHALELIYRIRRFASKYYTQNGVMPSNEQISRAVKVPVRKIEELMNVTSASVSLDQGVSEDGEESGTTLQEFIRDPSPGTNPEEVVMAAALRETFQKILESEPDRVRTIITMRFGLDGNGTHTLEEVGNRFGVTRERIRQIEANFLRKMKRPRNALLFRDFLKS